MQKFLFFFAVLFVAGKLCSQTVPSSTENYVFSTVYLSEDDTKKVETIQYFDGLGRPKQILNVKASPDNNDIVTIIEYDAQGRQDKDFLPMPQSGTTDGKIYSPATTPYSETVGSPLYGSVIPFFSQKEIENSPLSRPQTSAAPGAWGANDKKVTFDYRFNQASEVKKYYTDTTWPNGASESELKVSSDYSANELYKNTVTDEDLNQTIEFKNKQGQTVLVRKILSPTQNADTYYVYNEYQDLAYVLPPKFSDLNKAVTTSLASSTTDINELCYQYRYDGKNRLVEKKLPGKGWEYMVYDNQDRLVMTQDGNMGVDKKWLFTKYDQYGRVVYTGIYLSTQTSGSPGRNSEQGTLNGKGSNNVARTSSSGFTAPGLPVYYDNDAAKNYPNTFQTILSVNYYDTYPIGTPTIPPSILDQPLLGQDAQTSIISTKSLPLASYVKNLDNTAWTKSFIWYDTKGRPIGTHTINHLGGFTKTETELDFTGTPKKTFTYHSRKNATTPAVTIEETYTYDLQNRLLKHEHKINNNAPEILAENEYNEIGQLEKKRVGNNIQEVKYSYNIRGWMTGINLDANGNFQTGKLFNYKVNYNDPLQGMALPNADFTTPVTPQWNGNIAEVLWRNRDDTNVKRYGYVYDKLNRLLAGLYQSPLNLTSKEHSERLTYDLNGNVETLKRSAHFMGTAADLIDDLTYNNYVGNKFTSITDATQDDNGYEGGGGTVHYDLNGNMTDMPDKGISAIAYNFLNLPSQFDINEEGVTDIIIKTFYSADGTKLKKTNTTSISGIAGTTTTVNTTDYLDGFQYLENIKTPDDGSTNGIIDELETGIAMEREAFSKESKAPIAPPGGGGTDNAVLQFVPTAEGFYDFLENRYIYQYKDHLGNTRVTYAKDNITGVIDILDKNNYYPFGMNHLDPNSGSFVGQSSYKNYKYNGKELQETGMYDYGARIYTPDIARWGVIDPLAETSRRWNPYTYAFNNPIRFIDPDGMEGEDTSSDSSEASSGGGSGISAMGIPLETVMATSPGAGFINSGSSGDSSGSKENGKNVKTENSDPIKGEADSNDEPDQKKQQTTKQKQIENKAKSMKVGQTLSKQDIKNVFGSKAASAIEVIKKTSSTEYSVQRADFIGAAAGISKDSNFQIIPNQTIKGIGSSGKMESFTGVLIKTHGLPPAPVKGFSPTHYIIKGNYYIFTEGKNVHVAPINN